MSPCFKFWKRAEISARFFRGFSPSQAYILTKREKEVDALTPEKLEQLIQEHSPMMEYIVQGILPDPHEAEDCLAQIKAKLWEKAGTYDAEKSSPATWLTAVCRNAAYDRLRALKRQSERTGELSEHIPDPAPGPEELVLRTERQAALRQAIARLSVADQQLFYRKYYYLQPTARIAAELSTSERAVEGRLYRIRKKLQKQLGGDVL